MFFVCEDKIYVFIIVNKEKDLDLYLKVLKDKENLVMVVFKLIYNFLVLKSF